MNELELKTWLTAAQLDITKRLQTDTYFQFVLTLSIVLFFIGYLSILLFMPLLIIAIFIYKQTFDKLALMTISLKEFRHLQKTGVASWHDKEPYIDLLQKFEGRITQTARLNQRFGYRILFYLIVVISLLLLR